MVAIALIKQYINNLVNNSNKISLNEFFIEFHNRFCPEKDISFMEYFLELCDHEGEFCVPHNKLIEYGIVTSNKSNKVKEKLGNLGLIENNNEIIPEIQGNYRGSDVHTPVSQGGFSTKKVYYLTPESFKLCLMRAQRRPNQPVDPIIYANYYLLLEQVHKYYCLFQLAYDQKIISMKDDKIDLLIQETQSQSKKIDKLLNYSNAITRQNVDLLERTDHLQITADMTQEELDKSLIFQKEILNHLVDKSYKSTMNPANPNQITNFAVLMPNKKNGRTILVRGQVKHAINLIINAKQAYEDYRDNYIDRYNAPIIQYNDNLRAEINEYNKQSAIQNKIKGATFRGRRSYYDERMPLLTTDDIPIKFGTTFITYKKNKHIRYKEVIQCIKDVNELTQKSPAASDDGN